MNKVYPLMLIAGALTLGGCLAEQEQNRQLGSGSDQPQGSTQQDTAKVTFSAKLPDGPHAAYIDPKTQIIRVQVRESSIAGYDVAEDGFQQVLRDYFQCLDQVHGSSVVNSAIGPLEDCGPQPGSNQFTLVAEGNITADESAIGFNLRPDKKYRFSAALYASEADRIANNPFAWATTFARLEEGNNDVELNLIYGSWTFDNEPQLQLLNRDSTDLGVDDFESGFTWDVDETTAVPAVVLGLIDEADQPLNLKALHIADYPRFTTGNPDFDLPKALALESTWAGPDGNMLLLDGVPIGVAVPHNPLLEFDNEIYLGEGFNETQGTNDDGDWVEFLNGLYYPVRLFQQYDPTRPENERNSHALGLGDWEVVKFVDSEELSLEVDYFAGLFFYNPLDEFFQRLQQQEAGEESLTLDGVEIWEQENVWQEVMPNLTIARLEVNNFQSVFNFAEGTNDFAAILDAKPSLLTSPSQIETTLIEYVGRGLIDPNPDEPLTPPTFNEDGSLVAAASQASKKRDSRRSQWIRAQIKHQVQMRAVSELLGEAPPMSASTGCYLMSQQREITDSYYQLIDGVWTPGDPISGYWFLDSSGELVVDENDEPVTRDSFAEAEAYVDENEEAVEFRSGLIGLNTEESGSGWIEETEIEEIKICLQPATLTAGPYRDPRDTSDGNVGIQ